MSIFGKMINKARDLFSDETEVIEETHHGEEQKVKTKIEPKPTIKEKESVDEITEREMFRADPTFKFPVMFDDVDLNQTKASTPSINTPIMEKPKLRETYQPVEKKPFKPSPVISPVFGLVESEKKDDKTTKPTISTNKKPTIDEVISRNYKQEPIKVDNNLYEGVGLRSNRVTPIVEEKEEVEEPVSYKGLDDLLDNTSDHDFYTLVDSMYKNLEEGDE